MGAPTRGRLRVSNGITVESCNPSLVWSDDSEFLAVPKWVGRSQKLMVISVTRRQCQYSRVTYEVLELHSFSNGVMCGMDSPHYRPNAFAEDVRSLRWLGEPPLGGRWEPMRTWTSGLWGWLAPLTDEPNDSRWLVWPGEAPGTAPTAVHGGGLRLGAVHAPLAERLLAADDGGRERAAVAAAEFAVEQSGLRSPLVAESLAAVRGQAPFQAGRRRLWQLSAQLQDRFYQLRAGSGKGGAPLGEWMAIYRQACAARALCHATEKDLPHGKDPLRAASEATYEAIDLADEPPELFRHVEEALK